MTSQRQLAAIMFTDISGFSAMMQDDESHAREVLQRHRSVLEQTHKSLGGNVLQYIGDGTLSIFNSAVAAVECAVAMQVELRQAPYVPLRIGIHTGDITYDENGAFGDGVNVSSRVERLCLPGAVYITEKVYDDIKNHAWLDAIRLGKFRLHNINSSIDLYAISSKDLTIPITEDLAALPEFAEQSPVSTETSNRKKGVAFVLALLFGILGVHRFYLGQRGKGIAYLAVFGVGLAAVIEGEALIMIVMAILGFVDAVLLLAMPQMEFDRKYNQITTKVRQKKVPKRRRAEHPDFSRRARSKPSPLITYLKKGMKSLSAGRYQEAIKWFDKVLDLDQQNKEAHYYLACCFSLIKEEENAFVHLSLAVKNGFADFERIKQDINLYFLRAQPTYEAFVKNGYKLMKALPEPQPDLLSTDRFDPSVLDKIELLGDKLEKGELSDAEFQLEKQKILRGEG
ncbi:MAG: NINE protein [Saprospiraceae bacterium]|nr:NINE protein [Saprospiraceae bacterium]